MEKIAIPNGIYAEVAEYKNQVIKDYTNNPYIEALPELLTSQEVISKLAFYPDYDVSERSIESHYRIHMINRLFQIFQPLPMSIELESKISRAVRQGYISRNPFSQQNARDYYRDFAIINNINSAVNSQTLQMAYGFSFIGISGLGKTSSLERVLGMYPQVITHSHYKGINMSAYQVVWIKLECPFDSSVKGLLTDFFATVDRLLGTNYHEKVLRTRPTTDIMISIMNLVVRNISLGMLIIDEIQNLSLAKSGGSEKMLNLFVNLMNSVGVFVLLVGTPAVLGILKSKLRLARRSIGQGGDMLCERMVKDKVWDLLVNSIWRYQWTMKESKLTQEIIDTLYAETQGIPDLLKKVYGISQVYAITSCKEEITPSLIRQVSRENLKLVQPMLLALRTGDLRKIAKFDDIYTTDFDFESIVDKSKQGFDFDSRIKSLKKKQEEIDGNNINSIKEKAVVKLVELGIEINKAKKVINSLVDNSKDAVDSNSLVIEAISFIKNPELSDKKNEKRISNLNDVRIVVEMGKEIGKTAYEALLDKGYIKKFEDDIFSLGMIL